MLLPDAHLNLKLATTQDEGGSVNNVVQHPTRFH